MFLNVYGAAWWLFGLLAARGRGRGRRGAWIVATVATGLLSAWTISELLKLVFMRPRPFLAIPGAPETLVPHPTTFSFPSGDASLAFGAAVALGTVLPRLRIFAVLLAAGIALARVGVGVHYPADALAGAFVGTVCGLAAPRVVGVVRRRLRWRAFVVAHTHWDREWYERFEGYRRRLVPMVSRLLTLLEREPAFRSFTFDGQTIALEDHLAVRPDDRPRIERLVREDRLLVGPWYVLADLLLVSGESIIRNFQEGLRVSASFGRAMRVGYVADPFGHPAQMPQLLRGFGYGTYVFARGVGDEGEELGSEFHWEAPSGDRVLASHQVGHYSNAYGLVAKEIDDDAALRRRVRRELPRIVERTAPYASGDALLFMVGDDHVEAFERLPEAVAMLREAAPNIDARVASLEDFVASLPVPRGTYAGEMVSGKYRPILRGVNSTRVWIKQENAACERLLLERCEPLDALTGGAASGELRSLWRTLLENHPHDSICGCSIDDVHDIDMAPRFERVRREGEALAGRLAAQLAGTGDTPVVWNALPWERDAVVEVDGVPRVVRCAALGVAPVTRQSTAASPGRSVSAPSVGVIENEALRVEVEPNGSFHVVERATGKRSGRHNVLLDEGDRGDEYTYSYMGPTAGSRELDGQLSSEVRGDRATVTAELVLRLPAGARQDRLARTAETVDCPVRFDISLDAGSRRVDVRATVTNGARDHRLRVLFETGRRTITHRAGGAFAWVERPNRVPRKPGWKEPPTGSHCLHDVVDVRAGDEGLTVGVDGLRDYEVLHDGGTVAVTLLRAVGWLSRDDLRERPGGAGPQLETPSAQCLGERSYRYCVVPFESTRAAAARAVREALSPAWPGRGDGVMRSFLSLAADDGEVTPLTLSALRAGADGSLVVRLVNSSPDAASATMRFARPVTASRPLDLREGDLALGNTGLDVVRTAAPLELRDGAANVRLAPYEIGTWRVELAAH